MIIRKGMEYFNKLTEEFIKVIGKMERKMGKAS